MSEKKKTTTVATKEETSANPFDAYNKARDEGMLDVEPAKPAAADPPVEVVNAEDNDDDLQDLGIGAQIWDNESQPTIVFWALGIERKIGPANPRFNRPSNAYLVIHAEARQPVACLGGEVVEKGGTFIIDGVNRSLAKIIQLSLHPTHEYKVELTWHGKEDINDGSGRSYNRYTARYSQKGRMRVSRAMNFRLPSGTMVEYEKLLEGTADVPF